MNEFLQLTNLKKLGLCVDKDLRRMYHSATGIRFNCLRSLKVISLEKVKIDIVPIMSCYPQIHKLKLETPMIKLLEVNQFSTNLVKLKLFGTHLKEDKN